MTVKESVTLIRLKRYELLLSVICSRVWNINLLKASLIHFWEEYYIRNKQSTLSIFFGHLYIFQTRMKTGSKPQKFRYLQNPCSYTNEAEHINIFITNHLKRFLGLIFRTIVWKWLCNGKLQPGLLNYHFIKTGKRTLG